MFAFHMQQIDASHIPRIAELTQKLNPSIPLPKLKSYLKEMFPMDRYYCFGLFCNDVLIGVSSAWVTVRLYSGKQLELDNVVIDENYRGQGLGKQFLDWIENWAKEHDCNNVELNTYVQNSASHKFYYANGYNILGFHFVKKL